MQVAKKIVEWRAMNVKRVWIGWKRSGPVRLRDTDGLEEGLGIRYRPTPLVMIKAGNEN